jgi:hypothetical protein
MISNGYAHKCQISLFTCLTCKLSQYLQIEGSLKGIIELYFKVCKLNFRIAGLNSRPLDIVSNSKKSTIPLSSFPTHILFVHDHILTVGDYPPHVQKQNNLWLDVTRWMVYTLLNIQMTICSRQSFQVNAGIPQYSRLWPLPDSYKFIHLIPLR